jgi:hypothetical protein
MLLGATALLPVAGAAQSAPLEVPVDTIGLADGPYAAASMRLEKTIFKVDVLRLEIRFTPASRDRIREAAVGAEATSGDERNFAIADAAAHSEGAWARIRFDRDIKLGQFVDAARESLSDARQAGYIDAAAEREIGANLPRWYAFLAERKIRKGDEMHYRIRGDTLRTVYLGRDGDILLDQVDVGPERVGSVLGGYFARGSDFREPLLRSLAPARAAGS